jgi:hypothetical protein
MVMCIIFLVLLSALAFAALHRGFGFESWDGMENPAWEKQMNPKSSPHH